MNDYERLGGREAIAAMIEEFVRRVFADTMIGFHFRDADPAEIARLETQFACRHLGGPEAYEGRPLDQAHAPHPITGGQFMRRLRILQDVLEEHGVEAAVIARWLAHAEKLRPLITRDAGGSCSHPGPGSSPPG